MGVRKCCIETCRSCSSRKEDTGVTYHKFPKDPGIRESWIKVTHLSTDLPTFVCSRHFCKKDFQLNKDSKYVLKSDAVPSIFSWNVTTTSKQTTYISKTESKTMEEEKIAVDVANEDAKETLNNSKESDGDNIDAIKQFIEDQEKEITDKKNADTLNIEIVKVDLKILDASDSEGSQSKIINENDIKEEREKEDTDDDTMAIASSVMDMILSESEAKIMKKKDGKILTKHNLNPAEKANSMSLSVGSKVEAKDYGEFWCAAQIVEVDYDEMEVLVHYETVSKHDEWINVSSPRLRPIGSPSKAPPPMPAEDITPTETSVPPNVLVKEELKHEEKPKLAFVVGERCLARWRDNRRFIATISSDFGDGKYEIMFDDGVRWTCNTSRLSKIKDSSIDTVPLNPSTPALAPSFGPGPSNTGGDPITVHPTPAYHTHLFDPTRDYLGSKSERRERKRKLNIKEIFNIGQKKKKIETTPKIVTPKVVKEKKPRAVRKKIKEEPEDVPIKTEIQMDIPDAVASIIGTVSGEEPVKQIKDELTIKDEIKLDDEEDESKLEIVDNFEQPNSETLSAPETQDMRHDDDPVRVFKYNVAGLEVLEEEVILKKFEQSDDANHGEVIDRIKEVITKLEDGLNEVDKIDSPKPEPENEIKIEAVSPCVGVVSETTSKNIKKEKPNKSSSKIQKGKKMRLLQEKKVKKQVEQVKNELEEMKKQVEEMRKQMLLKTEELEKSKQNPEMPESFLLPGEWCCKWVNGQPVGTVVEMESETKVDANNKPVLPRRSVQVEDKRLPEGWTKHMVRRSLGNSAGKWDIVLVNPQNKRFHTKNEMRNYIENFADLKAYESALMDFGVHLKLSRRMGWYATTPGGEQDKPEVMLSADTLITTSPLVKRKSLSLKKEGKVRDHKKRDHKKRDHKKRRRLVMRLKVPRRNAYLHDPAAAGETIPGTSGDSSQLDTSTESGSTPLEGTTLEDGYVYVGSLKVQIIENLLRCPAEGCFKNFRNNTLLKMHIKHYHRELTKQLGATPKVLDLAYARTRPTEGEMRRLKLEAQRKTIKVKLPRLPRHYTESKMNTKAVTPEIKIESPLAAIKPEGEKISRSQDSPKLRHALINKPVKRPKVLLPVRRPEPKEVIPDQVKEEEQIDFEEEPIEPVIEVPLIEPLDFETAISTHTVTKPLLDYKRKGEKKRKSFATISKKPASEDEEWMTMNNSDLETRSSYPRSGTPDSRNMEQKLASSESNEEHKENNTYMFSETGERIKIVHMRREEIINCHCGFREEDGLMVQCELCLCWQHALCHNIQKESEVPEKYTCSICLNPRRGRRSQRFLHDQDRLYEGLLPGAKPCESLRRSHELSGNLLRIDDALHALRVKYYVATKKDHPKLYLWAKDWETGEINIIQEKLNSDYSDLNIMISNIGKENLPIKAEDMKDMSLDMRTPPSEDPDGGFTQRDNHLGSQALLSGLLSSPGGASLDLPISTSELERLAKTVQEQESQRVGVTAPQPEAAIENSACRERLLRHIQRCQAVIDARLDSIEAQVAELESQDPSFEDDETADYFPRTKQTIQMMMRDLDTMEELGVIT